jgi:hypothetical protein
LRPDARREPDPTLLIKADRSVLLDGELAPATLRVSQRTLVARHWPCGRPGPLQLEQAIDDVENAIEQAGLSRADRGVLYATASPRNLLPQRFNVSAPLSREDVEAEFSRLVAASHTAGLDAGCLTTEPETTVDVNGTIGLRVLRRVLL